MPPSKLSAVLAAGVLVLAACSPASTQARADGPLQRFYDQKLTFEPCDNYATTPGDEKLFASSPKYQCARLEVPLDYDDPDGDTAQIALLRVPARGKSLGPLLLNSGGPGGAGMNFAAVTAANLAKSPVTERFDLVGFDPRGVAASTPAARCFTAGNGITEAASEFITTDQKATAADTKRLADACTTGSGGEKAAGSFASLDTARDMDVLRAALGQEKLNFLGQSYGTRIGALYAREFPQNVRAMVVDGAVDPHLNFSDRRVSTFAAFQKAFDAMVADCASRPNCGLGQDAARGLEAYQSAIRPLVTKPLVAKDGRELTFNDVAGFTVGGLYDPVTWPVITKLVGDIGKGNPETTFATLDRVAAAGGDSAGNFADAGFMINCMDNERLTPDQAVELRERVWAAAPFLDPGHGPEGARDACEAWPAEPKPTTPFPDVIEGLPATLTISITNDTTTPHSGGISLAKTLGGSLLTVDGWGHTIAPGGKNACVNKYVADYLVNLKTPPADARCVSK